MASLNSDGTKIQQDRLTAKNNGHCIEVSDTVLDVSLACKPLATNGEGLLSDSQLSDFSLIGNLGIWLDASCMSCLTLVGNQVSAISSRPESDRTVSLVQASSINRPTLVENCMLFSGTQYLVDASASIHGGFPSTAFGVVSLASDANIQYMLWHSYALGSPTSAVDNVAGYFFKSAGTMRFIGQNESATAITPGVFGALNTKVIVRIENTGSTMKAIVNAVVANEGTSVSTTSPSPNASAIGALGDSQTPHDGSICEILQYDRLLTPTEIAQVEEGLASKWNISI